MKLLNKITFFLVLLISSLSANAFYIDEPILKSKMYIEIHGNKNNETIVFVHGLGDEASTIWKDSVDRLKENYQVIIFDLPGFGKSSKSSAEYTPEKYALVLDYIVSEYVNKPFYLVGHSMGGAISLKYTQLYESKVKKLFLIDAAGILHKDAYSYFLIKTGIDKFFNVEEPTYINNKMSNLFSNISSGLNKLMPPNLDDVVKKDYLRNNLFQSNPTAIAAIGLVTETFFNLEKIKTPTFILWGEKDEIAPLRTGYVLNKLITNSTLKIIEGAGHVNIIDSSAIYLDKFLKNEIKKEPKEFNKLVSNSVELRYQNNLVFNCNSKSIKIIDSKNVQLENCNLENLYIQNSTISIINSNIDSTDTALKILNSNVNITATDIKGKIAIDTFGSNLDLAAVNIRSSEVSILSRKTNKIVFTLTTLIGPLTKKILHRKIIMNDNNKL